MNLLIAILIAALQMSTAFQTTSGSCPATRVIRATAPPDPNVDGQGSSGNWYQNADRTIWVEVPAGGWLAGGTLYSGGKVVNGQKTYWVRPNGTQLVIAGRRLDGRAAALEANVPCCYPTGFQIVALHFPTEGCWQVSATAGDRELTFVTEVKSRSAVVR